MTRAAVQSLTWLKTIPGRLPVADVPPITPAFRNLWNPWGSAVGPTYGHTYSTPIPAGSVIDWAMFNIDGPESQRAGFQFLLALCAGTPASLEAVIRGTRLYPTGVDYSGRNELAHAPSAGYTLAVRIHAPILEYPRRLAFGYDVLDTGTHNWWVRVRYRRP